jgi:hypothetical protein
VDGPAIAEDASSVRAGFTVLGEARAQADDLCSPSAKTFELDIAKRQLVAARCLPDEAGLARMTETRRVSLDDAAFARVASALGELHETGLPKHCGYDGSAYSIEIVKAGKSTLYLDENYNCYGRTDVKYVAPSPQSLIHELDAMTK